MDFKNVTAHFAILKPKYPISQLDTGKLNIGHFEVVLVESEGSGKLPRSTKELPSFIFSRDLLQKSSQLLQLVSVNVLDKIGPGADAKRCIEVPMEITEKDRQAITSSTTAQPLRPTTMLQQNESVSPHQKNAPPVPLGPKPKYPAPSPVPTRTPTDLNSSSEYVLFVVPLTPDFAPPENPPSLTNVMKNYTLPHFYALNLALDSGDRGRGGPFTSSKGTVFFLKRVESWLEERVQVPGAIEKLFAGDIPKADTMPWKNPLYFQETVIPPPSPNSKATSFANYDINNNNNNNTNGFQQLAQPPSAAPNALPSSRLSAAGPRSPVDIFIPNPRFMRKKALEKQETDVRAIGAATPIVQSTNEPEQIPPISSEIRAIAAGAAPNPPAQPKPTSSAGAAGTGVASGAAALGAKIAAAATAADTGTVRTGKSDTKSESVSIEMDKDEDSVVIAVQSSTQEPAPPRSATTRL